jgi:hypothetical protein
MDNNDYYNEYMESDRIIKNNYFLHLIYLQIKYILINFIYFSISLV